MYGAVRDGALDLGTVTVTRRLAKSEMWPHRGRASGTMDALGR
jgi:hypothetical protein